MEKGKNEFVGMLCNLYIVALLAALPLYTGQGYWQLGNTKYTLFRNITLLCLGCWLVMGMPERLRTAGGILRKEVKKRGKNAENKGIVENAARKEITGLKAAGKKSSAEKADREPVNEAKARISRLDLAVGAYGICVLVSAAFSSYGQLAWYGYEGWFMGAVSQLLFIGIYFFVSRQYAGASWPVYLGETALFLVTAAGLLHRLGIDPLGLLEGWNNRDWEYSHMLSTLGNINWLCGYYSVALAFLTAHYLQEERLWLQALLYTAQVCAFVLLGVQGSQGGLLILAVCVGVSLWLGRHQAAVLKRTWLALTGFFTGMPLMWRLMRMRGEKAAIVADGNVFDYIQWYVWVMGAAVSFLFFLYFKRKEKCKAFAVKAVCPGDGNSGGRKKMLFITGCALAAIVPAGYLFTHPIDDGFGSGRGFLWRIAAESFSQADWKDKLLGAGPDCYGEAVFNRLGAGTEVWKNEHWDGSVFTNAHNEFLSQLCNVGILGTVSYLAIFIAGLHSAVKLGRKACSAGGGFQSVHKGKAVNGQNGGMQDEGGCGRSNVRGKRTTYVCRLGVLALAMYGMHSLVSFQQTLNTPLLFAVLGICEAGSREAECI